jgi:hypothetical protein
MVYVPLGKVIPCIALRNKWQFENQMENLLKIMI